MALFSIQIAVRISRIGIEFRETNELSSFVVTQSEKIRWDECAMVKAHTYCTLYRNKWLHLDLVSLLTQAFHWFYWCLCVRVVNWRQLPCRDTIRLFSAYIHVVIRNLLINTLKCHSCKSLGFRIYHDYSYSSIFCRCHSAISTGSRRFCGYLTPEYLKKRGNLN